MVVFWAVIPTVVLMIFIYKKDKLEKEPMKLLWTCFLFGVLSTIPVCVVELLGEELFESSLQEGSVAYALVDSFLVVALSEEVFKFLMLKWKTFKSPDFNCKFDAVVYAVFVSMGFAAFENIFYLYADGIRDGIYRMFTAIPAHGCDAVFMGYFYGKAKQADVFGNKKSKKANLRRAILVPTLLHGIYDCLISVDEQVVGEDLTVVFLICWILFVITLFVISFILVNKMSKEDMLFSMQRVTWECNCGCINNGKFCVNCGAGKSSVGNVFK